MGVRPAGRERQRQRKREREKEKGIETSGVRKGRPVKKLHSVFAQCDHQVQLVLISLMN